MFIGHGKLDPKVSVDLGRGAVDLLRSLGSEVKWKVYEDLGHWYEVPTELDDIVDFIRRNSA